MSLEQRVSTLATAIGNDVRVLYTKIDKSVEIKQQVPIAVWVMYHGLGKFPSVTTVDSGGEEVIGDVKHDDVNQVTITFSAAFSGSAFFN